MTAGPGRGRWLTRVDRLEGSSRIVVHVGAAASLVGVMLLLFVPTGSATPTPPYYGPAVLSVSSLVGYWGLDETTGTTASDQAASPANGTYHGGVTLGQSGAIQTTTGDDAVAFNGSNAYVQTSSVSKLQPSKSLTLEAWFKTTSTASVAPIVSLGWPSTGCGARLSLNNGHVVANVACGVTESSSGAYNDGSWHYAVLTWDGSKVSVYVAVPVVPIGLVLGDGGVFTPIGDGG